MKLFYVHDPMCSWCWAFSKNLHQLQGSLDQQITLIRLLGGLAPDTLEPMPEAMQQRIISSWQHIERSVPDIHFNFDFWRDCQPRRATYAACRAVIAARRQHQKFDVIMTRAIQNAYYLQAKNPSEDNVLYALADESGLDMQRFKNDFTADTAQHELAQEIRQSRELGVESFPSLVLQTDSKLINIPVNYVDITPMLEALRAASVG